MRARCIEMGQEIFKPIDVAGWQENHDWISTGTLPMRWEFIEYILNRHWAGNKEQFRAFIISFLFCSNLLCLIRRKIKRYNLSFII